VVKSGDKWGLGKTEMFIGEFQHSIDEKGRLAIPRKFRKELDNGAIVTRGLDSCLFVYPVKQWKVLAEKLAALPFSTSRNRKMQRFFLAGATDVEADGQGRVVLPEHLRAYAGIRKEVIVIGLFDRVEIWDVDAWNSHKAQTNKDADMIAEELGGLQ
jgi:MraZ protein